MEKKESKLKDNVLKTKPISLKLKDVIGTGDQQVSKHYDAVLGVDIHWTYTPPLIVPAPLPHAFIGVIFDPMDYIVVDIPIPSFLQGKGEDAAKSIPLGGTVFINGEHKATTTTSVMGVAKLGSHATDLPSYKIINKPGAPHDGEIYYGAETVIAQESKLSGDDFQHVLTCWCPPMGLTSLPNAPEKLSKNPLRYFAFYNHRLSAYLQIPVENDVIVGGKIIRHKYTPGELFMRFAAMGIMKGATRALKFFNNSILKKGLGDPNPVSRAMCALGLEPVNFVTGGLLFDWDDFEIGGNIPIKWSNTYYSNYHLPMGSLGNKNYNNWDLMIIPDLENGAAAWINPNERIAMSIPWVEVGQKEHYYRPYKIHYHRPDESTWILVQDLNTYYYNKFTHPEHGEIYKCTKIVYNDGSEFTLHYQGHNWLLYTVEASDGRTIVCEADKEMKQIEKVYYQKGSLSELQVSYSYDDRGNITHVWDRKDKAIHFEYDDKNLLVRRTNRNGMQYVWRYDKENRVVYTSGIDKFQEGKIVYHPDKGYNEVIYLAHPDKREEYHYDENNLVYKKVDAMGGETWYDYTANLERQLISSPDGKTVGYKFDPLGNITEMVMPDGQSHKYVYNQDGLLTHRIDARGNMEYWEYDSAKRVSLYLNPLGQDIRYDYEDDRRLPNRMHRMGKLVAEYQYNAANQLVLLKAEHSVQQWEYDAYGRLMSYRPKESVAMTLQRDDMGRVATYSQTNSADIQISYDAYDLPIGITDGKLQMELAYTPMGSVKRQLTRTTHDKQNIRALHYAYDAYENLMGIRNEKNEQYRFIRNGRDEVVVEIEFDGTQKKYTRDADGQVTRLVDSHGTEVLYQYDIAGRLSHITYDDGNYETYYYDENGLLIEAENQHSSVQYTRNGLGQVTQEKQGEVEIDYHYNDKGQLTGIGSSLGADISYGYNDYGELTQVGAFNAQQGVDTSRAWQAIMRYTEQGQLQQQEFSGGVQSEFEYDHLGRMTTQKVQVGKRKPQLYKNYHWSTENKLVTVINELIGKRTAYQYDEFGGLAAANYEDGESQYKTPDVVGNIYESKSQKDRVYDKGGKLLRDRQWYYHYDSKGNLRLKTKRKLYETAIDKKKEEVKDLHSLYTLSNKWNLLDNDWEDTGYDLEQDNREIANTTNWWKGDWHYKWSSNGMLEKVLDPEGKAIHFEYDALGRRTAKIANNTIYRYIWDGDVLLHEWHYPLSERPTLSVKEDGTLGYSHTEPLDNLVTWVYENGSYVPCGKIADGQLYSIISDYIGRPVQVYNAQGFKVWSTDYDIYGRLRNLEGNREFIPFRQLGQYEDIELEGLYYNRFRYYDSNSGLYISKDPIGLKGGFSLYSYVKDANTGIDPLGLYGEDYLGTTFRGHSLKSGSTLFYPSNRDIKFFKEKGKMPGISTFNTMEVVRGKNIQYELKMNDAYVIDTTKLGDNLTAVLDSKEGHVSIFPSESYLAKNNMTLLDALNDWQKGGDNHKLSEDLKKAVIDKLCV